MYSCSKVSHFAFQESVFICGTPQCVEYSVNVNNVIVQTESVAESIASVVGAYLCFNLVHPKSQEAVLEAIEGLLGLRKTFSSSSVRSLVQTLV